MGAARAHAGTRAAAQARAGTRAAPTELSLARMGHGAGAKTAWVDQQLPPGAHLGEAIALMRARGLRASAARRLVLEALLVADGPMSAEQIAQGIGGRRAADARSEEHTSELQSR